MSGVILCGPHYEEDLEGRRLVYDFFSDWNDEHDGWFYIKTCPECGGEMRLERNLKSSSGAFSHYEGGDWWGIECPPEDCRIR